MTSTQARFEDEGVSFYSFVVDECLVVCPQCSGCARVLPVDQGDRMSGRPTSGRRLQCSFCHLVKDSSGYRSTTYQPGELDGLFGLSLWLQTRCCGEILWARNAQHLLFLEHYVGASLRGRSAGLGYRNSSLASRLPAWIKSRKNRAEIMKSIELLKEKLNKIAPA